MVYVVTISQKIYLIEITNNSSKILHVSCENRTTHISKLGRQNGCLVDNKTLDIRSSFKMFPESLYFLEVQRIQLCKLNFL